jgi:type IX secretion system PorP/SprF family membrane protein
MKSQMKNISIRIIAVFFLALIAGELRAQQVPLYNQYYYAPSLAYPSGAVFGDTRSVSFVYRDQFGGLVGSPKNFGLAYTGSKRGKKAFSANVTAVDIGFTSQVKLSGGMGYKLFGEGNEGLSLGAQVGLSFFSLNEERVNPENPVDNVLIDLLGQSGSSLSLDLSLSYRVGKLRLDMAVPTVLNESLTDDAYIKINDDNVPDFIGGAGYEFMINPDLTFSPYLGIRLRETIGAELDVMGELNFKDKFRAFGGYRDNYGPTIGIGAQVFPKLLFTYNYDFGQKDTPFLADGFNEFGLHYQLDSREQREDDCTLAGEAVVNRIVDEKIFDENLVGADDRFKALCYFSSLEEGKRKEKNLKAEEAYQALFAKVKADELARQEASRQAKLEQERQEEEQRKAAAARAEKERLAEIEKVRLRELERLAKIKETEIKNTLSLATESVGFAIGSTRLTNGSRAPLDAVAQLMKENADIKLTISGYTDNTGNEKTNLRLSKQRADAVRAYLVEQGVNANRLKADGYGIANPRADNSTPEGRALNRRVEIKILN